MPTAVAAGGSPADHPMVRLVTAPPGPCHSVITETLSGTSTAWYVKVCRAIGPVCADFHCTVPADFPTSDLQSICGCHQKLGFWSGWVVGFTLCAPVLTNDP